MTVQTQDSFQYYNGPIVPDTVLSITDFTFIDNSHVSLKIRGIDEVWEYGTDYVVEGAGTLERTITLYREVEDGQVLAAYLDVPITQNISPEEGGNFPASTNEFVLDKLTYICQMLYERLDRAIQVSVDTAFSGTLPAVEDMKGRAIIINQEESGFTYSDYSVTDLDYIAHRLYASIANVDTVADNINSVITDATNISDINTVADAIVNVILTGESITNVNIVGNDLALGADSAINKVNANKTNIDTNAENIVAIQNASTNAQTCIDKALEAAASAISAGTNATNANIWAEGTDEQVETLGGTHSAKGWADQAAQGQIQSDFAEDDPTKKSYIRNKPNLVDGYYPDLHVGLSDNLYDESMPTVIDSFWFRTSAGNASISSGPAILNSIRGNLFRGESTPRSGSAVGSSGITITNFNLDQFEANDLPTGSYEFDYNEGDWTLGGTSVTLANYGLSVIIRQESLSITDTSSLTVACSNITTFANEVSETSGTYTFVYVDHDDDDDNPGAHLGPYWTLNDTQVDLTDYALTVDATPTDADSFICDYVAPVHTGTITVNYVKAVIGELKCAKPEKFFSTSSMNQYNGGNSQYTLSSYIQDATIDSTGQIVSNVGTGVACCMAVGGIYSGYVAYSANNEIIRIGYMPGTSQVPEIGDTVLLDNTVQDSELSSVIFADNSVICVAVNNDTDLSIHPRWSSGQDQDHTYDAFELSLVDIPTHDKDNNPLPTYQYGLPSIGDVYDELNLISKRYTQRIARLANTSANMATVQAYGTAYVFDENYIYYVLKDLDIIIYELDSAVSGDYDVNDYGTEGYFGTNLEEAPLTTNISYGSNLKDKLRTNVLTISEQELLQEQKKQVQNNLNLIDRSLSNCKQITNCILNIKKYLDVSITTTGVLTVKAGSKLLVPYGLTDQSSQFNIGDSFVHSNFKITNMYYQEYDTVNHISGFFVEVEVQNDIVNTDTVDNDYTRDFLIDLTNNCIRFRGNALSANTAPTISSNAVVYRTDLNQIHYYTSGVVEAYIVALPLGLAQSSSITGYMANRLVRVFNGIGFIGDFAWLTPITVLHREGLASDNTYISEVGGLTRPLFRRINYASDDPLTFYITKPGGFGYSLASAYSYNPYYYPGYNGNNYSPSLIAIGTVLPTSGQIKQVLQSPIAGLSPYYDNDTKTLVIS